MDGTFKTGNSIVELFQEALRNKDLKMTCFHLYTIVQIIPLTSVFQLLKLAFSIFYSHSSTCNQSPWAAKGLSEETSVPAT